MANFKPILPIRGRAALLAAAMLAGPLHGGEAARPAGLADSELAKRSAAVEEAQELLRKGDEAYQKGRYAEAVEAYAGARDLIPDAPVSSELRRATTERYAQASVERARELSRKGDVKAAKDTVDKVLAEGVAPDDPGALDFRAQLDDPIRTNPALDAEHTRDVDQVRRLLYTAEGAFNLGKFDESVKVYQDVLRIDPTNSAARRGMERVAAAKSGYQKSAADHTRAEMLGQVEAAWANQVPAPDLGEGPGDPGAADPSAPEMTVDAKLDSIIIPKILMDQATLDEAVDFLRNASRRTDIAGGGDSGVNFTVNLGPPDSEAAKRIRSLKFDLQLSNVPLRHVLKILTDMTQTSFKTDDFAVVISPAGSTDGELVARTYRVPPDFLTSLSAGAGSSGSSEDPFAEPSADKGLLTKRLSAQEALVRQGVSFPEGSSASYINNTLRVVNTANNQDLISQIVAAMTQTEPVLVSVRVTMIRTEQTHLEELGFDWLVSPFALSANNVFGGGGTVGNGMPRTSGDFVSPVNGTTLPGLSNDPSAVANPGVVTNGLRSGDGAISNNSIENLINNPGRAQQNTVAPGILSVTGLFSDGQAQMIMRGLDQKKGVDIMAKPSTVTRSGQQATVEVLREFIYPTEYEPPELPNSVGLGGSSPVTPATPTAFETKPVGIQLEVLPVADANKRYVDLTINPSFSDFDGFVNYGNPIQTATRGLLGQIETVTISENAILMPVFSAQRANTQITVADGATIAIGGLMASSIQNVEDKVPVLGNVPILGRLFSSTARKPVNTAIIFLVHVELVDPTGRPYRDR